MLRVEDLCIQRLGRPMLAHVRWQVEAGQVVCLMGPSGSGKSTVLHWMVGALDTAFAAQGELWLGGERRETWPVAERRIGILFQDDLLFGHWTVGQNLLFALPAEAAQRSGGSARARQAQRRELVQEQLAQVGLAGSFDRDPATLSGGQRARVSLLRALLARPQALLLDEPFARLDAELRVQFRAFVFETIAQHGLPTVLVTHDHADVPMGASVYDMREWQVA